MAFINIRRDIYMSGVAMGKREMIINTNAIAMIEKKEGTQAYTVTFVDGSHQMTFSEAEIKQICAAINCSFSR